MNIKMKQIVLLGLILMQGFDLLAQTTDPASSANSNNAVNDKWKPALRRDGAIDRVPHNNVLIPWEPIREADVLWKKRVWREIDIREKQNFPFRYPGDDFSGGGMYIEILMDAIKKGKVTAFADEGFRSEMKWEDVQQIVAGGADTMYRENPDDGSLEMIIINKVFNPEHITKFRVKEDWIFDRNLGRMQCRILGISAYLDKYSPQTGEYQTSYPIFWINYEDLRPVHVQYEVYNPENDVFRVTWDDFFEKRLFSSFIIKSSINNPFMEDIKSYKDGIYRLYEANEIKEKIFNKEHDLWVY